MYNTPSIRDRVPAAMSYRMAKQRGERGCRDVSKSTGIYTSSNITHASECIRDHETGVEDGGPKGELLAIPHSLELERRYIGKVPAED